MHTSFEITPDMEERINNLITGKKTISLFCYEAMEERVNRMEARSERARLQIMGKNKNLIEPIMLDILRAHGIMK